MEESCYYGRIQRMAKFLGRSQGGPSSTDELFAEGLLGLAEARTRFAEEQGNTFWTFAQHRIRGRMIDCIRRSHRRDGRLVGLSSAGDSTACREGPEDLDVSEDNGPGAGKSSSRTLESTLTACQMSALLARSLLSESPSRRHLVVECRLKNRPVTDVAREVGLSRVRAQYVLRVAMVRLRKALEEQGYSLEDFR